METKREADTPKRVPVDSQRDAPPPSGGRGPGASAPVGRSGLLAVLAVALLVLSALLWRLSRPSLSPGSGADAVSGLAVVEIAYGLGRDPDEMPAFQILPPTPGSEQWDGRRFTFMPHAPLRPETAYTLTLSSPPGFLGLTWPNEIHWSFRTRPARVLYLTWQGDGRTQLAAVAAEGSGAAGLTGPELDVSAYAVGPRGDRIALIGRDVDGPAVWLLRLADGELTRVSGCAGDCARLSWAPDGSQLLLERRERLADGALGPTRLWWVDLPDGAMRPVFADDGTAMTGASLSAEGSWLSYHLSATGLLRFVNLETGATAVTHSDTNQPAAWSRQGEMALVSAVQIQGEAFVENILRLDLAQDTVNNLSGARSVADGSPAWSPSGEWIAFNRRLGPALMGRQLAIMRADGRYARQLTEAAGVNHGPPRWSPDESSLVYQRYDLNGDVEPSIWLIDVATGAQRQLAPVGAEPTWLP